MKYTEIELQNYRTVGYHRELITLVIVTQMPYSYKKAWHLLPYIPNLLLSLLFIYLFYLGMYLSWETEKGHLQVNK